MRSSVFPSGVDAISCARVIASQQKRVVRRRRTSPPSPRCHTVFFILRANASYVSSTVVPPGPSTFVSMPLADQA
ncbi:hypothetical protein [Sorangium cellulosum]|uniref:Uncharacterized protein n=1 Tax=Sorangium cellulosum TaxID=56 RepID=A0A150QFJ6_SORCE|nr:hypothetical protein [Sorangium cellulosum]KYF66683.1 hypothetical protein BE15_12620 [Sorangium cellulosum]